MELGYIAGFGWLIGLRHVWEPDHIAAISTLATGERCAERAAWLGAWWGLGHTLTLLIAGFLLAVLRVDVPTSVDNVLHLIVITILIGLGIRSVRQGWRDSFTQSSNIQHWGARGIAARPLMVGMVHGLAGTGALMALIVRDLPSVTSQFIFLGLFGIGSIFGMTCLSGVFGWQLARIAKHRWILRSIAVVVGSFSITLGVIWGYPHIALLF